MALNEEMRQELQQRIMMLNALFVQFVRIDSGIDPDEFMQAADIADIEAFLASSEQLAAAFIAFAEFLRLSFKPSRTRMRDLKQVAASMCPDGEVGLSIIQTLRKMRNSDADLN